MYEVYSRTQKPHHYYKNEIRREDKLLKNVDEYKSAAYIN